MSYDFKKCKNKTHSNCTSLITFEQRYLFKIEKGFEDILLLVFKELDTPIFISCRYCLVSIKYHCSSLSKGEAKDIRGLFRLTTPWLKKDQPISNIVHV